MSTATLDDPFASAEDFQRLRREEIITAGRYRLPNLDGSHKKGGWQRVTNLVSAFADQFGLRMWEMEQIFIAYAARPEQVSRDIRDTVARVQNMMKQERRGEFEALLDRCKAISGGNEGAAFGNARHAMVEADHLALPALAPDAFARQHLALYRIALERNDLYALEFMQERRVCIPELDAIGTLDNILLDKRTDTLHVGDLKTQKRFWTWLEIAAQLACYAHAAAMWEPSDPNKPRAGRWVDMPEVDLAKAFVLWMPKEHPSGKPAVDVYEVDIVAGWETAKLARAVVLDRAGGKRKTEPRAWLREARALTATEEYAVRLACVETRTEGAALVAEIKAKGLWNKVLADEAAIAAKRVESSSN